MAIGDFDNDGWPDIFVCNFGKNRLYRNNHDGTFTDVAEKAGVTLGNWSDGATWGDYDGDGRLDLFVSGYVHYDLSHQPTATREGAVSDCQLHGFKVMCGPRGLPGEPDHLFHNNGDGTFTDVSVKGRGLRSGQLLRIHRDLCGCEQRWQAGSAGGERLGAQLSLHQQGRRNI